MPPESPVSEEHISVEEYPSLTDENVAILYQIVRYAEQQINSATQPFRAIFAAYEDILPRNGLKTEHDQVYLRFLLRLGERRKEGQTLYERFEALLGELGLQIEFVPDEYDIQDISRNLNKDADCGIGSNINGDRLPRRASFNSVYDAGDESTKGFSSRPRSYSPTPRINTNEGPVPAFRSSTRASTRKTEKTDAQASSSKPIVVDGRRDRMTVQERANDTTYFQRRHTSVPALAGHRFRQHAIAEARNITGSKTAPSSLGDNVPSDTDPMVHTSLEASMILKPEEPPLLLSQNGGLQMPSRTQLLRYAGMFHTYRIQAVARDMVDKWCFAALQARDTHEHMERVAAARDTEVLLRQAFEHWRLRLHAKKQAAEMKRYFDRLERRTAKARNLMLLSKAFTHWAQCRKDEALRMNGARQHILRTKYFLTWHDITVRKQYMLRSQTSRKFFLIWRQRYDRNAANYNQAISVRCNNIRRSAYWSWFWAFCKRRAPEWRSGRIRYKYSFQWVAAWRKIREQNQQAIAQFESNVQRKFLLIWLDKTRAILSNQRHAAEFVEQKQKMHRLHAWRLTLRYSPKAQQVSNMVDWRVAGTIFATFVIRYRCEKQAEVVHRLRVLRAAWTKWNDRLRWQALAHRMDDRFCLEALYKWVIAERFLLLRRLFEQRLKHRCIYKIKRTCSAHQVRRENSVETAEQAQKRRKLRQLLIHWQSRLGSQRQSERIAYEYHAPKVAQDSLQLWAQNLGSVQKLNGKAKLANYYFLMKRYFKTWRNASTDSKRQKRRNAYVQIRRKYKKSLVAGIWHRWRSLTASYYTMQYDADLDRLFKVGASLFDRWQRHHEMRQDQDTQARQHYQKRLVERQIYTWIERLENQERMEELAVLNSNMHVKNVGFGWLNKARLRIIEFKGQESNAENLRSWYEKRHFRNLLRMWNDKATIAGHPSKVEHSQAATVQSSKVVRARPRTEEDDSEDQANRAEDWTDFNLSDWVPALNAQVDTNPLPGYLSTPSRRAARAKAMVGASTTPIGTPLNRSRFPSTPRTSRKSGLGKSTTAMRKVTFGTILEDSLRTPGMKGDGSTLDRRKDFEGEQ